ncbi:MAG: HAD family phosphatase [Lachnospiraceae bacterium]|nr:HAD family phosphatase [Lachnospiraceae bacterium]
MKITNIIFDIGRVLVEFDWNTYLHGFGLEKEKEDAIARAMFTGPYWSELDRGVWSIEQLLDGFVSLAPQYRKEIEEVFAHSEQCISGLAYARPWLQDLKSRGFRVYYLSNYSEWTRCRTAEALNFLDLMNGGLFSYEVGFVKPDPAIFQALIDRYPEIIPEESVFFDDTAVNVDAACRFGLHGILFHNQKQAEHDLLELLKSTSF